MSGDYLYNSGEMGDMKKIFIPTIIIALICLSACSSDYDSKNLKSLTINYTLEQAKDDNCLIIEDGDITSGQATFDVFLSATEKNENATIRIVNYYNLGDKSQYSEELYEQEKDNYPIMYITDVVFENGAYTTYSYENNDDQLFTKTFKYMIKDEGTADPESTYTTATYYILVNDKNVIWNDVFSSMVSSQSNDRISFYIIYQKHNYK